MRKLFSELQNIFDRSWRVLTRVCGMVCGSGMFPCKKHAPCPIKALGTVLGAHGAEVLQGLFLPHFARVESDMHAILLEPTYLMSVGVMCVKKRSQYVVFQS